MKVIIAIDSFKGSLSTLEAGKASAEGIQAVYPEAEIVISPLADGGEGTVDAILLATKGERKVIPVHDPLGRNITASYGIIRETKTAVIEMAAASGITLVFENERDPFYTTTLGVGEMITDAISEGCREFIIGIGGSATNDGGIGMLSALGVKFFDKDGNIVEKGGIGLRDMEKIEVGSMLSALKECRFHIACDVKNPLCGENGCSAVFGPQKGLTAENIPLMDAWLSHYAELTKTVNPSADETYPGCGAAGGLGFAFLSYLPAELTSGIKLVMRATGLEQHMKDADIVITGEGRLDGQSCMGKAPVGVAALAKKYGKPVIAVAGGVTEEASSLHGYGIDAFFPIVRTPCTLGEAMKTENAYRNLKHTAEQIFRVLKIQALYGGNHV